jgi:hypothetical protein
LVRNVQPIAAEDALDTDFDDAFDTDFDVAFDVAFDDAVDDVEGGAFDVDREVVVFFFVAAVLRFVAIAPPPLRRARCLLPTCAAPPMFIDLHLFVHAGPVASWTSTKAR